MAKALPNPYDPAVLALWETHGFTAEEARAWLTSSPGRFTPWTARQWAQKGFDPDLAGLWSDACADPEEARQRLYAGTSDPFARDLEADDPPPPPPDSGPFGSRLRRLRVRARVSLFRLALVTALPSSIVHKMEWSVTPPPLDRGVLIAEALGVSPRHLAFGDDPPRPKRKGGLRP